MKNVLKRSKFTLAGRLTEHQTNEIEKIFWENNYSAISYVIRDLIKIGLKYRNEIDKIEIDSPVERSVRYISSDNDIAEKIKKIKKERKIKDTIVIIRTLIEIGLKHRDELPNRAPSSSA